MYLHKWPTVGILPMRTHQNKFFPVGSSSHVGKIVMTQGQTNRECPVPKPFKSPIRWRVKNRLDFLLVCCLTVVLLIASGTSFPPSKENPPRQPTTNEEGLERGRTAYARPDYRKALENWKTGYDLAIAKDDRQNESKLLTRLGVASRHVGQYEKARGYFSAGSG